MGTQVVQVGEVDRHRTAKEYLLAHGWEQNDEGRWLSADEPSGVSMSEAAVAMSVSADAESGRTSPTT